MYKRVSYADAVNNRIFSDYVSKRLIIMIPAHNEEYSIGNTLDSLVKQDIVLGVKQGIFIALDNCTDNTEEVVKSYADKLDIFGLITVDNKERKAGALNQLYKLFFGDTTKEPLSSMHEKVVNNIVAFLGIDADVYLAKDTIPILYRELTSKYKIGSISAKYTCLMPESSRILPRNDPDRYFKLKTGKYSGFFGKWLTAQQNAEFSAWTISQLSAGRAEISGGQCSMFQPEALKEVYDKYKLNGIYDNETDTEDLLLTQEIRALKWDCVVSPDARCYVDSMVTYSTYISQRMKWVGGTVDYMLNAGISNWYGRRLWWKEFMLFINLMIRLMLIVLVPAAIILGMFQWIWIWALPILAASVLNFVNVIKTPNHRLIDIILATLNISPELYLWITLWVHLKVWINKLRPNKKDGWALQYQAEQGLTKFNWVPLLFVAILVAFISILWYTNVINLTILLGIIKPWINHGFNLLTDLTIFMFVVMILQMFKFRGNWKA